MSFKTIKFKVHGLRVQDDLMEFKILHTSRPHSNLLIHNSPHDWRGPRQVHIGVYMESLHLRVIYIYIFFILGLFFPNNNSRKPPNFQYITTSIIYIIVSLYFITLVILFLLIYEYINLFWTWAYPEPFMLVHTKVFGKHTNKRLLEGHFKNGLVSGKSGKQGLSL